MRTSIQEGKFNPDLITDNSAETDTAAEAELAGGTHEREAALREELTSRREEQHADLCSQTIGYIRI